jgi:hypothetical protein
MLQTVDQIAERLNALAESLAPKLLPNGHRSGNNWMASGIADTGLSASLYVYLTGDKRGHWTDAGNAAPGEEFGDMLDLLRLKRGLTVAGAVAEAKVLLGIHDPPRAVARLSQDECRAREEERRQILEAGKRELAERQRREAEELQLRIRRAKALYLSGNLIDGSGAEWYLRNRGLRPGAADSEAPGWPGVLRYHPQVWCADERVKVPAMLAAFYTAQGEHVATHRTFLTLCNERGWVKIDSPYAKKVLGPMNGAFIPINKGSSGKSMRHMPEGEWVYITEGIEDALVVRQVRPAFRIVCAGSLVNMGAILLPEQAKTIVIVCDRDPSERAQDQLERAIGRHQARGIKVRLVFPGEGYKDYNEWLLGLQAEERRQKP